MRVELINTGSELMLGFTVNTHLPYLAGKLAGIGLRIARQTTIADNPAEMRAAIADSLTRADILIITGGLGPTSDDITRDIVAEALGRKLIRDETVADAITERFRRRGWKMLDSIQVQSLVPEGGKPLLNAHGTAPGILLSVETTVPAKASGTDATTSKLIVLLPGPPRELKPMFEQQVLPALPHGVPAECRVFKVAGLPESIVEGKVAPVLADIPGLELGYCARPGEVEVRIIGNPKSEAESDETPSSAIQNAESLIRAALGHDIFGTGNERLEEVVVHQLTQAGKTVATAESCTGGLIANRITNVSGSSAVFRYGWVVYHNDAKMQNLGVLEETLKQYGAVSEEVAREMAEGARQRSGADFALSATGIAGPTGGTAEKPVGLVFIGLATPTGTKVQRHTLKFDRETFKSFVSQTALDMLRRELLLNANQVSLRTI